MKLANLAIAILMSMSAAWAQARISAHPRPPSHPPPSLPALPGHGFGNVVFPSGVTPRFGVVNPVFSNPGFAQSFGSVIAGRLPQDLAPHPGRPGIYPPIVGTIPVFVGGFGGYGYAPPPQQTVTIVNVPPPTPIMVINQGYTPERANPVMRDYSDVNLPEPGSPSVQTVQTPIPSNPEGQPIAGKLSKEPVSESPTIYLIALLEGTVYSAYAYWVEGDTLHYITTKHAHNRASLDLVDAKLSEQLNRERGVEFRLR